MVPLRVLSRTNLAGFSPFISSISFSSFRLRTLKLSCRSFSDSRPLFSTTSALFLQNTRGGIPLRDLVRCTEAQKCLSVSPLLATLTHSRSRKSFPCHSYANTRDGGVTVAPVSASVSLCLSFQAPSLQPPASRTATMNFMNTKALGLAILCLLPVAAAAQTADEILAKVLAARGGLDKLRAINSERVSGQISFGDVAGPLLDYKSKGNQIELVGKDKFDDKDVWRLKLTTKNGDVRFYLFDANSFLLLKWEGKRKYQDQELPVESHFSDYREVGGLKFAFAIDSGSSPTELTQRIRIEKIELNPDLNDTEFGKPATPAPPAATANPNAPGS